MTMFRRILPGQRATPFRANWKLSGFISKERELLYRMITPKVGIYVDFSSGYKFENTISFFFTRNTL